MAQSHLTQHARVRMQQRGIPADAIEDLLDFGRSVFFDKTARRRLARRNGGEVTERIARVARTYAVLGRDGAVRTIGWRYKRIQRN